MSAHADVRIVLVRPRDPRNVGAACRAMKCMGLTSLAIVPEGLIDPRQARTLAHYAADVLDGARVCRDLPEALEGTVLAAGTTRRRGKDRKHFSLFPEQLAERIASLAGGTVAVVFGNEDSGLSDDELSLCQLAVTIPTDPGFPSLNLSHAVQVVCYEILRARTRGALTPYLPVSGESLDELVSVITRSLSAIGFFRQVTPRQTGIFFKDILARAALSGNEARHLGVIFRKIAGLATGRGLPEEPDDGRGVPPQSGGIPPQSGGVPPQD